MYRIADSGDAAITLYFADKPGEAVLAMVLAYCDRARAKLGDRLQDIVSSYCSVTLYFDLRRCEYYTVRRIAREIATELCVETQREIETTSVGKDFTLPVYYGEEVAPDLNRVARAASITAEEVIALHSSYSYRVYALGFRPGFAFMGEIPPALRVPRLDSPRKKVPAGAVAIADAQAAIYPCTSPGGWNLIGRCPTRLFSCESGTPDVLLAQGDRVQFEPVSREFYLAEGGSLDD